MIIDVDYIRRFRQVAKNIDDSRVEVYISEAEQLDILPAIGADEYDRIVTLTDEELTPQEINLLNGGTYQRCGEKRRFMGLKAALSYLAYARFVRNHSTQITPFGVVVKEGDESSPATDRSIAAIANDAQRIGEAYLKDCVEYWRSVNVDAERPRHIQRRFIAIGD